MAPGMLESFSSPPVKFFSQYVEPLTRYTQNVLPRGGFYIDFTFGKRENGFFSVISEKRDEARRTKVSRYLSGIGMGAHHPLVPC